MVEAHRFFSEQARQWLSANGPEGIATRAAAIETAVRDFLQMVVIDLAADEMLKEYPPNADVEVMDGIDCSLPLTRDGLAIDPNGETQYLGGCDPAHEWD
jgi:hypothetical protein